MRPRWRWAWGLVVGLLLGWVVSLPAGAWAQRRLAVELELGGTLAAGAVQRSNATLLASVDDPSAGSAVLFDERARLSRMIALRVLLSSLEVGYSQDQLRLGESVAVCVGRGDARLLPNGSLDDTAVRYDCSVPRALLDGVVRASEQMTVHHLGGGLRLERQAPQPVLTAQGGSPAPERPGLHGVVLGGLSMTTSAFDPQARGVRPGFHLGVGGGVDVGLGTQVRLTFSARYRWISLRTAHSGAAASGRALDRGQNVVSSVLDGLHIVSLGVGVRVGLR